LTNGGAFCYTVFLSRLTAINNCPTEEVAGLANIKSAQKRVKVIANKTAANRMHKSSLKTSIKKAQAAILSGDPAVAGEVYRTVQRDIDRAAAKGILHRNTASRRKSRLAAKMKAASSQ